MIPTALADAGDLLREVTTRLRENGSEISETALITSLAATRELAQLITQIQVETVAALHRSGAFTAHGHRRPESAVASVLGIDRGQAAIIVRAAEHLTPRVDPHGHELPAPLPAMAAAFAAGTASLAQVDRTARVLDSPVARQIPSDARAGIEQQIAAAAATSTVRELDKFATDLVHAYEADDPDADPDDAPEPVQVNELYLIPLPGGGGKIHGTFEDPVRFAMIATVLDAKSAPRTAEDQRSGPERAADALAEVCGFVADHADDATLPSTGGRRPHLLVTVQLDDLQNRAKAACLDFGGHLSPTALRLLCCDAAVAPVVLGGTGEPLDVGRTQRTIPPPLRNAVTARDRGCAFPGCDRPPGWTEIHHLHEWAHGGHTRLDNLVMLCRLHHREIHSSDWMVRIAHDGLPEFIPPEWIDKNRRPRRHPRVVPQKTPPEPPPSTKPLAGLTHALR